MVGPMIKHIRHSKYGKSFVAGSKTEISREPEELEENVLDDEQDELEIPEEDVRQIRTETGKNEDEILSKVVELGTADVSKIIAALKEE